MSLALGAEATFVGRALDSDKTGLTSVLRQAAEHRGSALVEIYQNCPIFNDGAFDVLKDADEAQRRIINVVDGEPIRFGREGEYCVVREGFGLEVAKSADVGRERHRRARRVGPEPVASRCRGCRRRTSRTPSPASSGGRTGRRTTTECASQVNEAKDAKAADLGKLLHGKDTWTVVG